MIQKNHGSFQKNHGSLKRNMCMQIYETSMILIEPLTI